MSFRVARRSLYSPSPSLLESSASASPGSTWGTVTAVGLRFLGLSVVASFLTPLVLGLLTRIRHKLLEKSGTTSEKDTLRSTLLMGRVWHTRFRPTKHAFSYPLFLFGVDLDDEESFNRVLWPLSWIMKFSSADHLINGEGCDKASTSSSRRLVERIYSLVRERTADYLRPTADSHRVVLVTHLAYYGYCFNPVSFYYLQHRTTGRMQAIVAEVSNTPWLEMYPYVLHPTSRLDQVRYTRVDDTTANFKFPKRFHVSPFMEMQYTYDWTFAGQDQVFGNEDNDDALEPTGTNDLRVTTAMVRPDDGKMQFTATMRVHPEGLDPMRLAWQLALYPSYCIIIQLWIHYEAFWLFWKGVAYCPHPEGAETIASRIIGTVMTPFFELQTLLAGKKHSST
jgi:DUF1365 family protein